MYWLYWCTIVYHQVALARKRICCRILVSWNQTVLQVFQQWFSVSCPVHNSVASFCDTMSWYWYTGCVHGASYFLCSCMWVTRCFAQLVWDVIIITELIKCFILENPLQFFPLFHTSELCPGPAYLSFFIFLRVCPNSDAFPIYVTSF